MEPVETTLVLIVKSIVIFLVLLPDRAGPDLARAQGDEPDPVALRAQPGRARRG